MISWKRVRLGELIQVRHGFAFRGEYFSDHGKYIVLTPGNFFDEGGFKPKSGVEKFYAAPPPNEHILRRGDLVVAMTEQVEGLLGSSALIPVSDTYLHNQRIGLVVPLSDQVDREFLYYLFNTKKVRDQIQATATGSKIRHTAPSRIEDVIVDFPPLSVQQKLAAILSAYDDLIENNNRRIKLLEEMAQRIYREWFVDFRFPGHEVIPPIESESGPIPDGWKVSPIGNVTTVMGGGTPSKTVPQFWEDGDIVWYTPSDLTAADSMFMSSSKLKITEKGLARSSARLFPAGSVMMTSRATIGVVSITAVPAATNQGFITCPTSDLAGQYHLYFWLKQQKDVIISLASGATFKEINKATFRQIAFLRATSNVEAAFEDLIEPFGKQIKGLLRAQQNLRLTRDLLLPRLISGEIDVTDLEIVVAESAA